MYSVEWFTTVYAISCSKELALSAYDLFLAGVDDILLRLGVALLAEAQDELLALDSEGLQLHFKKVIASKPTYRVLLGAISTPVPPDSNRLLKVKLDLEMGLLVEREDTYSSSHNGDGAAPGHQSNDSSPRRGKVREEEEVA